MPNWDEIRKEFESSKITLAALAEKHGVKLGTLKSRKGLEGWSKGSPKKDATKKKKVATIENKDATKSYIHIKNGQPKIFLFLIDLIIQTGACAAELRSYHITGGIPVE